jgi:hypothetical protein
MAEIRSSIYEPGRVGEFSRDKIHGMTTWIDKISGIPVTEKVFVKA